MSPQKIDVYIDSSNKSDFKKITDEMLRVHLAKNADYGNAFEESMNEEGITSARVRIGDKWRRFRNLSKSNNPKVNESLQDTLLDMANYAIMTIIWLNKQNKKQ